MMPERKLGHRQLAGSLLSQLPFKLEIQPVSTPDDV